MKEYFFGRKILRNKLPYMCRYQCKDSVIFKVICTFKKIIKLAVIHDRVTLKKKLLKVLHSFFG